MINNSIFITGTNTGVGKTLISALLLAGAHAHGIPLNYFKPLQTGEDSDCDMVKTLTHVRSENILRPVYEFKLPAAVCRAAQAENTRVDLARIVQHWQKLCSQPTVIEGAGGLLHPINEKYFIRDLILALKVPLLIVASTQLGTMNHTLLTLEAALMMKIPVKGIILSGHADPGLMTSLQQFMTVPILAEIPFLPEITPDRLQPVAESLFRALQMQKMFESLPSIVI